VITAEGRRARPSTVLIPGIKGEGPMINCSICGNPIDVQVLDAKSLPPKVWEWGHNAEPVTEGRCCSHCNDTVVIPRRIKGGSQS
jgi:hypothetical protein